MCCVDVVCERCGHEVVVCCVRGVGVSVDMRLWCAV